ncbi:MAG TPA: Blp family class II bacteriocin [Gammaproteobacteria bacterium]
MECAASSIRELSAEEVAQVAGGFTWTELGGHMLGGAVAGAMMGSLTVVGAPTGALAGALTAGASYIVLDLWNYCF